MPRTFFKIVNELAANQTDKQHPLYLFSSKLEDATRLSFFISSCDQYCWIKENKNNWQKTEIDCLPATAEGLKIYYIKHHNGFLRLEVPSSFETNVQLIMGNQPSIPLDRIRVTQAYLKKNPDLSALLLGMIPFNKAAQQQLVLEQKKQTNNKDIQYLEMIKNLQQLSMENAKNLSANDRELCYLIEFVIEKCEQKIQELNEQPHPLPSCIDESASAMATLKI